MRSMKVMSNIGAPPSIMIVDDTPANLEALSDALAVSGYRVRSAPNGRLALQAALSDPPDLILLDIMMPEMDGYEVCRILKENGATRNIPVIFITAMDRDLDEERGLSLGAVDYITKPIRLPIVLARVKNHVQMKMQRDGIEMEVMSRTAELGAANRELKIEIAERTRAEEERERTLHQQEGVNLLQQSLLAPAPLDRKLKSITDGIVRIFDADFCRIWLIKPGDRCEQGCVHEQVHEGPHVCRYRDRCLHLVSSSGRYVHIDGKVHRRVPFGCYKIGLVASGEEHKFITNDVRNDPRVHNHEWARGLGLVSFAGYQLLVPGEKTLGVLALFARHPLAPAEDAMLDGLSSTVALIIQQAKENEALRISEEKFRNLIESSRDAIMLMEPPAWGFTSGNPASVAMFREESLETLISQPPWKLSPEYQPGGRASAEMAMEMIDKAMREGSNLFEWIHRRSNGENFPATVLLTRVEVEGKLLLQATLRDITERKQAENELRRKNEELDLLVNSIASIIIGVSVKDRITHWNPYAEEVLGFKARDMMGTQLTACTIKWEWDRIYEAISTCISEDRNVHLDDIKYHKKNGSDGILELTVNPLKRGGDVLEGFIILGRDLTERRILENQLQQARKLEAIGQLAAGVAHEINSPLQYVGDNMKFIITSINDIIELQKRFVTHMEAASGGGSCLATAKSLHEYMSEIDLEYLTRELPKAAEQTLEGVNRISTIVKSMKAFAHPGTDRKTPTDINKSIANTITVSRNEWKYVADVETEFDPGLVPVPCFAAELNQVILNMIVNAVDAIKEARVEKTASRGIIRISTKMAGGFAEIRVADNGAGIPEEIRQKVFDPFFTTKEVGEGTGQGLSIAFAIIVTKHGGTLRFETETGRGTTFIITLPLGDTQ